VSTYDIADKVKRGDVGIIEGPAIGCKDADAANKVTVDFGAGKRYYMRSLWGMYRQDARVPVLPPCMMALQVAVGLMLCSGAAAGVACTAGQHQGQQHTLPVHRREQPTVFE
jgi:hypothetical protein